MPRLARTLLSSILLVAPVGATSSPVRGMDSPQDATTTQGKAYTDDLLETVMRPRRLDLPELRARGVVRVLVTPGRTGFEIDGDTISGFEAGLLREFERALASGRPAAEIPIRLVYIPLPFEQLIPALEKGVGDVVAAGVTVTPDRAEQVAFSRPYLGPVDEVVVASADAPRLTQLEQLAGRSVHVPDGSSFADSLERLSETFRKRRLEPIRIHRLPPSVTSEATLELVDSGALEYTVADRHVADAWSRVLEGIHVYPGLVVRRGGMLAWAVRTDSPKLLAAVNDFLPGVGKGTRTGNALFRRHFEDPSTLRRDADDDHAALAEFMDVARRVGSEHGFDPLLIAAQAYCESRLDASARSPRGAVGVMQVKPSVASEVGVDRVDTLEGNVEAGVTHLARLRDTEFAEETMEPLQRMSFCLAAYHADPATVRRWRGLAARRGLDPARWFGGVELVALRDGGRETVDHVRRVHRVHVLATLLARIDDDAASTASAIER